MKRRAWTAYFFGISGPAAGAGVVAAAGAVVAGSRAVVVAVAGAAAAGIETAGAGRRRAGAGAPWSRGRRRAAIVGRALPAAALAWLRRKCDPKRECRTKKRWQNTSWPGQGHCLCRHKSGFGHRHQRRADPAILRLLHQHDERTAKPGSR